VTDRRVLGVSLSPPIESRQSQGVPNDGVDRIPVLDVEEVGASWSASMPSRCRACSGPRRCCSLTASVTRTPDYKYDRRR
jgi:hypothetical protein